MIQPVGFRHGAVSFLGLLTVRPIISVDAVTNSIELRVSAEELEQRRKAWTAPPLKAHQGTLYKYIKTVEDASHGCITDA